MVAVSTVPERQDGGRTNELLVVMAFLVDHVTQLLADLLVVGDGLLTRMAGLLGLCWSGRDGGSLWH